MDPHYYGRYAMAGWVLVAVLLVAAFEGGSLTGWIADFKGVPQGAPALAPLIKATLGFLLGAVVGIGAPPAVGFLLERVTAVLLWLPAVVGLPAGQMSHYPDVRKFSCSLGRQSIKDGESRTGAEYFHICFYSYAGEELIGWTRRRRMQMYASFNALLALACGLALVRWVVKPGECPQKTYVVSVVTALFLLVHGVREALYHRSAICAWARALTGSLVIGMSEEESTELRQKLIRARLAKSTSPENGESSSATVPNPV